VRSTRLRPRRLHPFFLRRSGLRPWRPRACPRVARPCPRWCLILVSLLLRRRVVGVFLWFDAVVAARALPRHAMVVSPGRCVSVPFLLLLLCILLQLPGACSPSGACSMPSMRAAPFLWGLLHAGHAHLKLALAKLTWSLCWPCSSGACAGRVLFIYCHAGSLPQPLLML
jgi:hypothetical protein